MSSNLQIALIDDDAALLDALSFQLDAAGFQVFTFSSVADFLLGHAAQRLDCIVCDYHMPGFSGMDLLRRFLELKQNIPFIMLTAVGTIELAVEATQLGSANFLQKGRPAGELIAAIQKAVQNPPSALNERLQAQKKLALLTPREQEVFRLICDGLTSKQMARLLKISDRTIETHRANLTDKLGIQSPAQLNELRRKAE